MDENHSIRNILFWLGVVVYIVSFIAFYPQFFSIADEDPYLKASYHMIEGKIIVDDIFNSYAYIENDGKYVPSYQLGNSAIILPFAFISWKLIFLSGLFFHMFNLWIFTKILKKFNLNKIYGLLYLLYPGLIFYSRTVMSEIPTITFTLLGFYFYLLDGKYSKLLAGFMWGISCLIRPTNALLFIGFLIPSIFKSAKISFKGGSIFNKYARSIIEMCIGALPSIILILAFNYLVYGGIFNTRYAEGGTSIYSQLLSFDYSLLTLYWKPLLIMSLIYPVMFLAPFIESFKVKSEIITCVLLFFFVFGKFDVFRYSWIVNLIIGARYFFPILPLLFIPYSISLERNLYRIFPLVCLFLIFACPALMYVQDDYTDGKYSISKSIYSVVPTEAVIVINGDPQYVNDFFGENPALKFNRFIESDYVGEYYLVDYHNHLLDANLKKEKDIDSLSESETEVHRFIEKNDLILIYLDDGLGIYKGIIS